MPNRQPGSCQARSAEGRPIGSAYVAVLAARGSGEPAKSAYRSSDERLIELSYGDASWALIAVHDKTSGPARRLVSSRDEIALTGGEPSLRVCDTSGPQDYDVTHGLPKLREPWVRSRSGCLTEFHYARAGEITPAMEFIAIREGSPPTSSATRWRAAGRSFPPTLTTSSLERIRQTSRLVAA